MRYLSYLVFSLSSTIVFQIALASPLASPTTNVPLLEQQIEMNQVGANRPVARYDVEATTNVTRSLPNYDLVAAMVPEMMFDSITKSLAMRDSFPELLEIMMKEHLSRNDILFVCSLLMALSLVLHSALGDAGSVAAAYILQKGNWDLMSQLAVRGAAFNIVNYLSQFMISILKMCPYGGKVLYVLGMIVANTFSMSFITCMSSQSLDVSTIMFAVTVGMAISFVVVLSYTIEEFNSFCIFNDSPERKKNLNGVSIIRVILTSACAGLVAGFLTNKDLMASFFVSMISLNPSLVGMLPNLN